MVKTVSRGPVRLQHQVQAHGPAGKALATALGIDYLLLVGDRARSDALFAELRGAVF